MNEHPMKKLLFLQYFKTLFNFLMKIQFKTEHFWNYSWQIQLKKANLLKQNAGKGCLI